MKVMEVISVIVSRHHFESKTAIYPLSSRIVVLAGPGSSITGTGARFSIDTPKDGQ